MSGGALARGRWCYDRSCPAARRGGRRRRRRGLVREQEVAQGVTLPDKELAPNARAEPFPARRQTLALAVKL